MTNDQGQLGGTCNCIIFRNRHKPILQRVHELPRSITQLFVTFCMHAQFEASESALLTQNKAAFRNKHIWNEIKVSRMASGIFQGVLCTQLFCRFSLRLCQPVLKWDAKRTNYNVPKLRIRVHTLNPESVLYGDGLWVLPILKCVFFLLTKILMKCSDKMPTYCSVSLYTKHK